MTKTIQGNAPHTSSDLSRRRFVGMVGASGLAVLAGCGGGSSSSPATETPPTSITPPITNTPPPTSPPGNTGSLSLLAGGLGGSGMLEGRGTQARLPTALRRVTANRNGVVCFSGARLGKISAQGDVSFLPDYPVGSSTTILVIACDSKGDVYVIQNDALGSGANVIHKLVNGAYVPYAGATGPSGTGFVDGVGTAARLNGPLSPAFDSQDNLYFIDSGNYAVRKVAPDGTVSTVAGRGAPFFADGKGGAAGFERPNTLLVLADDSLLVVDGISWRKVLPDGTVTTLAGTVPYDSWPVQGTTVDSIYALQGHSVVKLALNGSTTLIAGDVAASGYAEGAGAAARFNLPLSLALSGNGQMFVADIQNSMIRKVDVATGQVSAWAGLAPQPGRLDGEGTQARFADMGPSCVDANGNVYVIDTQAKTLREITVSSTSAPGIVSTLFTNFPSDGDVVVDTAGNFYGVRDRAIIKVSPSGAQQVLAGQEGALGFADGVGNAARFARPRGLVLDAAGNLYVADEPDVAPVSVNTSTYTYGGTLRMVTPVGVVSTVAGTPGRVGDGVWGPPALFTDDAKYFAGHVHLVLGTNGVIWVASDYGVRRLGGGVGAPVWTLRDTDRFYLNQTLEWTCAPDNAGNLWLSDGKVVRKLLPDGSSSVVVGVDDATISGVKLGALPGSLGAISFVAAASSKLLYCGSENAVIRIQLD